MISQIWDKWFVIVRHAELVRWIVCGKEGVEKTVESALADEPNVADLYVLISSDWTGPPQRITAFGNLDRKLFAVDHLGAWGDQRGGTTNALCVRGRGF